MRYGAPYQGSKNAIAKWVVDILPKADTLVDLFGGGGAITHCAILSDKYKRVIYNDIGDIADLFEMAVKGKIHDHMIVPTREGFFLLKDIDPYVKYVYSFGNAGSSYIWSKGNEVIKQTASRMLSGETLKDRYTHYRAFVKQIPQFVMGGGSD